MLDLGPMYGQFEGGFLVKVKVESATAETTSELVERSLKGETFVIGRLLQNGFATAEAFFYKESWVLIPNGSVYQLGGGQLITYAESLGFPEIKWLPDRAEAFADFTAGRL